MARFASELPANTLLLTLDFDRADLAPDDADSIIEAIREQAELQLDGFKAPEDSGTGWEEMARALGKSIAESLKSKPAPLLGRQLRGGTSTPSTTTNSGNLSKPCCRACLSCA